MIVLNEKIGRYEIQYKLFDETEPIDKINFKPTTVSDDGDSYVSPRNISGFV